MDGQVQIKHVIITKLRTVGRGVPGDPIRVLTQIWDMQGNLLYEIDTEGGDNATE